MKKKAGPERVAYLAQLAHRADQPDLAKLYGLAMTSVARKSVVRLDRETKSRFCKQCRAPRSVRTTKWRIEDSSKRQNRPTMVVTCECGSVAHRPLYTSPKPEKTGKKTRSKQSEPGKEIQK